MSSTNRRIWRFHVIVVIIVVIIGLAGLGEYHFLPFLLFFHSQFNSIQPTSPPPPPPPPPPPLPPSTTKKDNNQTATLLTIVLYQRSLPSLVKGSFL